MKSMDQSESRRKTGIFYWLVANQSYGSIHTHKKIGWESFQKVSQRKREHQDDSYSPPCQPVLDSGGQEGQDKPVGGQNSSDERVQVVVQAMVYA